MSEDAPTPTRKPTFEELEATVEALRKRNAELEEEVQRLLKRLEAVERKRRRQAAPFGKDEPAKDPKRRGRKPGKGPWQTRQPPERIDETLEATLPAQCACGGCVKRERTVEQFQIELPRVEPIHRLIKVDLGACEDCGKRFQGRHAEQTSNALGAAGVQIGPNALALAVLLNKQLGVSWGRTRDLFRRVFGLTVAVSTFCRAAVERLGPQAESVVADLMKQIVAEGVVSADETGWRVNTVSHWLWVFANRTTTIHLISRSRGADVAMAVLGANFAGILCRDGWASYRKLEHARHQTCLAHLLRRIEELLAVAKRGQACYPHRVKRLLKAALALRDRRETYTAHGFAVQRGRLVAALTDLLRARPDHGPNRRLAKHLRNEADAILTFLFHPEVEATNWIAEQAVRPAVVNRKMSGGNRTPRGAAAQGALTSIIATCHKRGVDVLTFFGDLLRGLNPSLAPAAPG